MSKYRKGEAESEIVSRLSGSIPKFEEIFDEETFYIFAFVLVVISLIGACLASKYVNLKDIDHNMHKD